MTNSFVLKAGVALFALAAAPAFAQQPAPAATPAADGTIPDHPAGYDSGSGLDDLAPADTAAPADAAAPASTGNAILDRLNALEAQVRALQARNAELESKVGATTDRVERVEVRAARGVQPGVAPTFADITGDTFTFHPRGVFEVDAAMYNERKGGYDYNNGTSLRRGRFGFDGTFLHDFRYRLEAEFVGQQANILDAYVQWVPSAKWLVTLGQHKAPYGLEANTSDNYNTFLERSMGSNTFGSIGAERRIGASISYVTDKLNAQVGFFGSPESITRAAGGPDETYGVNGRVTWDPVLEPDKLIHLGASGYWVTNLSSGATQNAARLSERPNSRVDGGVIVDTGVIPNVQNASYVGVEGALVYQRFSVQGEYGHLSVDRTGILPSAHFDGYNIFGSIFLTGESRTFKNGVVDRLKPFNNFSPKTGHWGAFEVALRYDRLDLGDTPVVARVGSDADSITAALNWYLTPNLKVMFNYIRFHGDNSPLVVTPAINGTHASGDTLATRLHLDF